MKAGSLVGGLGPERILMLLVAEPGILRPGDSIALLA